MVNHPILRERIVFLLRRCHDSHRLLQKFAFGRGEPDDLVDLAKTIAATQDLVETLTTTESSINEPCVNKLVSRISMAGPAALAKRIRTSIDEEGLVQKHREEDNKAGEMQALALSIVSEEGTQEDTSVIPKGTRKKPVKTQGLKEFYSTDIPLSWTMQPGASPLLTKLHAILSDLITSKEELQETLRMRFEAKSLELKFTPGLGHYCHVKGKDARIDFANESTIRPVGASKSTRSFHHSDWTTLGGKVDQSVLHIKTEESRVFTSLREDVIRNIVKLRRNASVLDELDVACSFALLAEERNWIRPLLNNSTAHKIVSGRHPTVEGGLEIEGRSFITNDCFVGSPKPIWLITGPNMAGKSTFLRQNALITILAQVGSYVPASYAELGIVDQIFSRVGSADNLYKDQSTFMVEMLETAAILTNATRRSFVIMDEIGRGTTPEDGTAVAFACLHHLYRMNKCRVLFATHFHEVEDMAEKEGMGEVGYYCTDVKEDEEGEGFRYVYRLREGVNRKSHALKVAKLAGLPEEAIAIARRVLENGNQVQ